MRRLYVLLIIVGALASIITAGVFVFKPSFLFDDVKIKFSSKVPGYMIRNQVDDKAFNQFFQKLGITPLHKRPFLGKRQENGSNLTLEKLSQINVIFYPEEEYKAQGGEILFFGTKEKPFYRLMVGKLVNETTLEIPVYVKSGLEKELGATKEEILSVIGLRAIFLNLQEPPLDQNKISELGEEFNQKIKDDFSPIFEIKSGISLFDVLLQKLNLIAEVKAQSCGGSIRCGNNYEVGVCIGGERDRSFCDPDLPNPCPGGSCATERTCVPNDTGGTCVWWPAGRACVPPCGAGPSDPAYCVVSGSCNIDFPTSPPEPTTDPSYSCSGSCFAGISDCGEVGYDPASGSCPSGQLCCKQKSALPSCEPYGMSCSSGCTCLTGVPPDPYQCCPGLMYSGSGGGTCQCISCDFEIIPSKITVKEGSSTTIQIVKRGGGHKRNQPVEMIFSKPSVATTNPSEGIIVGRVPKEVTLIGLKAGRSTLRVSGIGILSPNGIPYPCRSGAIEVTVTPGIPTASINANPEIIVTGESSTLTWSSTNTSSCSGSGAWSGDVGTSGTRVVSPSITSLYQIDCMGTSGGLASDSTTVTVTNLPWWQAKGGSVIVGGGNISSNIPALCTPPSCSPYLILNGGVGETYHPGIAMFGGTSTNFGSGGVSTKGWLANSPYLGKAWNYNSFVNLIPSSYTITDIAGALVGDATLDASREPQEGYIWYRKNGDLTISGDVSISGGKKVILLVQGDLYINSPISLESQDDFLMLIVGKRPVGTGGNIIINGSVTNLKGVFFADNNLTTGTSTNPLTIQGSVVANTISLRRTGTGTTPSELFEYAPEIMLNYPDVLNRNHLTWKETVP